MNMLCKLLLVGAACSSSLMWASDETARTEVIQFLSESVDAVLRAGEKPKAWLTILGPKGEFSIVKVDGKDVTVLVQGNAYPAPWKRISNPELIGLAKSVANGKGERLLVAAEVALALGEAEEANRLLALAREADRSLEAKINAVAAEVAKAAPLPAKGPPKPVPVSAAASTSINAPPVTPQAPAPPPTPALTGPVLQVGPTRQYKTIASAVAKATGGTTVVIDPGTYKECMKLTGKGSAAAPVRIMGLVSATGERPVIDGAGLVLSGVRSTPRALFQVEGEHIVIENLEFKNARNGNNGAGIRLNGCAFTTVRNCKITYCDMGVQGGDKEAVVFERCEVACCGTKDFDGYSHNFYMTGNTVILRHCHVHTALFGQNFKSRAHYNELWYNYIVDSLEGEICLVDSETTDAAHSNSLLVGNVVVSKDRGNDRNALKYVDFGSDTGKKHNGTLYCFHNTFIAGTPRVGFIGLSAPDTKAVLSNNIFSGSDKIAWGKSADVKGLNNVVPSSAALPAGLANSMKVDPGFADAAKRDYRLRPDAAALNLGAPAEQLTYEDGKGQKFTAAAVRQPVPPLGDEARAKNGLPDPGAFEK